MASAQNSPNTELTEYIPVLYKEKRLLSPTERISEILFGLIMALTFTCSLGIANSGKAELRVLLIAAIGCNLAWGLVDATIHIITILAEKSRGKAILDFVRKNSQKEKVRVYISELLPPVLASAMSPEDLEQLRKGLAGLPESSFNPRLTAQDFKRALSILLLIFVSTFPVVLPFVFIKTAYIALRISNLVAILMMFLCGWFLARYSGYNKWRMSFAMTILGIILVSITVALGG